MLADVSGHGVGATMVAFHLDLIVKDFLDESRENGVSIPGNNAENKTDKNESLLKLCAESANNKICVEYNAMGVFVATLLGIIDLHEGMFYFIAAGSPPPLVEINNVIKELEQKASPPLGAVKDKEFVVNSIKMDMSRMLLFTDGIYEIEDKTRGEMLSIDGLANIMQKLIGEGRFSLESLYNRISYEYDYNFEDDVSIVMVEEKTEDLSK